MKQFFGVCAVVLVFVSVANGLECLTCNSEDDAECINNPTRLVNCAHFIADLPSTRFRCMTIHGKDETNGEFVMRRCTASNECKYQVSEKTGFEWGIKKYPNAKCEECQTDSCNNQKLV